MGDLHEKIIEINKDKTDENFDALCTKLEKTCLARGVLELLNYNLLSIRAVTQELVLYKINLVRPHEFSRRYSTKDNITDYISQIKWSGDGKVKEAGATKMEYILRPTEADEAILLGWEASFLEVAKNGSDELTVFRHAARSRTDAEQAAILDDMVFLSSGCAVVIVFVAVALGRFNRVQHKVFVAMTGVFSIVMALAVSLGLGSYALLIFSPMHSVLPVLLLGLGVYDMFVTVSALDNLNPNQRLLPVPERIGLALKSAGASILVTSLTSMLVFGVGISTSIPALRSFCAHSLLGILFTFIFHCTFFMAWLAVDERRADSRHDACLFCLRIKRWSPNNCSRKLLIKSFFDRFWAGFITHIFGKVAVVLVAAGLLAVGIYGVIHLEQTSDWTLFIPDRCDEQDYVQAASKYFPAKPESTHTSIYLIDVDYYANYSTLAKLHTDLKQDHYIESNSVSSWWVAYREWLKVANLGSSKVDNDKYPKTEGQFYDILHKEFLKTEAGKVYKHDIVFTTTMTKITASRNTLRHYKLKDTPTQVTAMNSIRAVVKATGFGRENAFPYSRQYLSYEGNKSIQFEMYRNLGLAFLCVVLMTLLLIANIPVAIFICLCVIMTVVEVGGVMYFWGVSINTVSSIVLLVAIALSIDYAAYVGHTFMNVYGSRRDRVQRTLVLIGPAILSGGFSAFLASILLIFARSYILKTFFKALLGVVLFGLFHGLVFLPILLSLIGPDPYASAHHDAHVHEGEDDGCASWDDTSDDERRARQPSRRHRQPSSYSSRDEFRSRSPGRDKWPNHSREEFRSQSPSRDKRPKSSRDEFRSRSPNRDKWPQRSRDEFRSPSPSRDKRPQRSRDEFRSPSPSRDKRPQRSRDEFRSQSPSRDNWPRSSRDEFRSPSPNRDKSPHSSRDEFRSQSPSSDSWPRSSRDEFRSPSPNRDKSPHSSRDEFRSRSPRRDKWPRRSRDEYRSPSRRRDEWPHEVHRGAAYSSHQHPSDRVRHLSAQDFPATVPNAYGVGPPREYVKPALYCKPASYIKPRVSSSMDDEYSPPIRRSYTTFAG